MQARDVIRIVSVTGAGAYDQGEDQAPHPFLRARHELASARIPAQIADGEAHMRILRQSSLAWTVVRAPFMTAGGRAHTLSSEPPPPSTSIPYRAVAAAMVAVTLTNDWLRCAPFVIPPQTVL
jgi:hypothetical protein